MGKRKRDSKVSLPRDHAIDIFIKIWSHLGRFPATKAQYALHWLWENEGVLKVFAKQLLHIDAPVSKALLCNGYRACKEYRSKMYAMEVWSTIDSVFTDKLSMRHLSQCIRKEIAHFSAKSGPHLHSHLERRIESLGENKKWTENQVSVQRLPQDILTTLRGYFSGDWKKEGMDLISEEDLPLCKPIPENFIVLKTSSKITSVYDRSGEKPLLVGMLLKEAVWCPKEKEYIRLLMSQLMVAHNEIKRQRCGVLNGAMVAYGPHFNTWEKCGGKKISYYKPVPQVKRLISRLGLESDFAECVDRHAHSKLVNIILGMFSMYCPHALQSFFAYSDPYLPLDSYEPSPLEIDLVGHGPCAYQLFVTEDYVSEYHVDDDATDFTLAFASHPDASKTSDIDFHLAEVGIRLSVGDGDAYLFRTDYGHTTGYRRPSPNPAYVACVTVNRSLQNLMRRRQVV